MCGSRRRGTVLVSCGAALWGQSTAPSMEQPECPTRCGDREIACHLNALQSWWFVGGLVCLVSTINKQSEKMVKRMRERDAWRGGDEIELTAADRLIRKGQRSQVPRRAAFGHIWPPPAWSCVAPRRMGAQRWHAIAPVVPSVVQFALPTSLWSGACCCSTGESRSGSNFSRRRRRCVSWPCFRVRAAAGRGVSPAAVCMSRIAIVAARGQAKPKLDKRSAMYHREGCASERLYNMAETIQRKKVRAKVERDVELKPSFKPKINDKSRIMARSAEQGQPRTETAQASEPAKRRKGPRVEERLYKKGQQYKERQKLRAMREKAKSDRMHKRVVINEYSEFLVASSGRQSKLLASSDTAEKRRPRQQSSTRLHQSTGRAKASTSQSDSQTLDAPPLSQRRNSDSVAMDKRNQQPTRHAQDLHTQNGAVAIELDLHGDDHDQQHVLAEKKFAQNNSRPFKDRSSTAFDKHATKWQTHPRNQRLDQQRMERQMAQSAACPFQPATDSGWQPPMNDADSRCDDTAAAMDAPIYANNVEWLQRKDQRLAGQQAEKENAALRVDAQMGPPRPPVISAAQQNACGPNGAGTTASLQQPRAPSRAPPPPPAPKLAEQVGQQKQRCVCCVCLVTVMRLC